MAMTTDRKPPNRKPSEFVSKVRELFASYDERDTAVAGIFRHRGSDEQLHDKPRTDRHAQRSAE
jgi:hypothetical protein